MIKTVDMPIVGAQSKRPQDDPQRTLNWYPEKTGKTLTLKPRPGTTLKWRFAINGGGRNLLSLGGRLFGVRGAYLQEILPDGSSVVRGALMTTQGKVAMVGNLPPDGSGQLLIVDDAHGYVLDIQTNVFTLLTEADHGFVGGLSQAVFCAGRAVAIKPGTGQAQFSDLYDFYSWPGTNFLTAESFPDNLVALASTGNLIYLFGTSSFEVWKDEGYDLFPYTPIIRGDQIGCQAPHSVVVFEKSVHWLGANPDGGGVVYRHTEGGTPQRISDHALERQIAALSDKSDAVGIAYQTLGHPFYVLTFPNGNTSIAWDRSTQLWHEQAIRDRLTGVLNQMPYIAVEFHQGLILALSAQNGDVWEISDQVYSDAGAPIRRERVTSVFPDEGDWMTYLASLELFGQVGISSPNQQQSAWSFTSPNPATETPDFRENLRLFVAEMNPTFNPFPNPAMNTAAFIAQLNDFLTWMLANFPGDYSDDSPNPMTQTLPFLENLDKAMAIAHDALYPPYADPEVMLRTSRDRGMTWDEELWQKTAGNSTYETRVRWTGLGSAYGFVFWLAIVADCYVSWRSLRLNAE